MNNNISYATTPRTFGNQASETVLQMPPVVGVPEDPLRWRRPVPPWAATVLANFLKEKVWRPPTTQPFLSGADVIKWWLSGNGIKDNWRSGELFIRSLRTSRAGTGLAQLCPTAIRTAHTQRFALALALDILIHTLEDWRPVADVLADDSGERRVDEKGDLFALCRKAVIPYRTCVEWTDSHRRRTICNGHFRTEYDQLATVAIDACSLKPTPFDFVVTPELHSRFAKNGWVSERTLEWDRRVKDQSF